ncbi:hypothetical protein [Cupriavidus taiwanensis]|uniref:hypothetical protein n=1 Tax=Cupriavidus taiwanensis TaxID=164546 RepID=UPI0012FF2853|nr:hypothetical protein [Cupriavidus taiwanensis]
MARIAKVGRCYARRAIRGKARRPLSRRVRRLRHEAAAAWVWRIAMSALLRAAAAGWQKSRGIWHLPGPWRLSKIPAWSCAAQRGPEPWHCAERH